MKRLNRLYRSPSSRGIALWTVLLISVVLTMMVVSLMSRQKMHKTSTLSHLEQLEREFLADSSMEWLQATLLSDLTLGTEEDRTLVYRPEGTRGRVTFRFIAPPSEEDQNPRIAQGDSFNNLSQNSPVTLELENGETFRLPARAALLTSNLDLTRGRATTRDSWIVKLEDNSQSEEASSVGLYSRGRIEFRGDTALVKNSSIFDQDRDVAWVMASENSSLLWRGVGEERFRLEGKLFFNPRNLNPHNLPNSLSDQIVRDREGFLPYSNSPYGEIDVAREVAKALVDEEALPYENQLLLDGAENKKYVSSGGLTITGDLELKEGVSLFVKGNLNVRGSITGKGSVYTEGDVEIEGSAELTGNDKKVALMSGGDVTLRGTDLALRFNSSSTGTVLTEAQEINRKVLSKLSRMKDRLASSNLSNDGNVTALFSHLRATARNGTSGSDLVNQMSLKVTGANRSKLSLLADPTALDGVGLDPGETAQFRHHLTNVSRFYSVSSLLAYGNHGKYNYFDEHGVYRKRFLESNLEAEKDVLKDLQKNLFPSADPAEIKEEVKIYAELGLPGTDLDEAKSFLEKFVMSEEREDLLKDMFNSITPRGRGGLNSNFDRGRRYDLANLIHYFENPGTSSPFLLDSIFDEFSLNNNEELKALLKIYGKDRFLDLLDNAISQVESIDFRYPGRSSFQGMLYAKGRVISDQPFHINGGVVIDGTETSTFSDGTLFSLTPKVGAVSQNPHLMNLKQGVFLKGGLL